MNILYLLLEITNSKLFSWLRRIKRELDGTVNAWLLQMFGLGVLAVGLVFLLWGLYHWSHSLFRPGIAYLLTAAGALIITLGLAFSAFKLISSPPSPGR